MVQSNWEPHRPLTPVVDPPVSAEVLTLGHFETCGPAPTRRDRPLWVYTTGRTDDALLVVSRTDQGPWDGTETRRGVPTKRRRRQVILFDSGAPTTDTAQDSGSLGVGVTRCFGQLSVVRSRGDTSAPVAPGPNSLNGFSTSRYPLPRPWSQGGSERGGGGDTSPRVARYTVGHRHTVAGSARFVHCSVVPSSVVPTLRPTRGSRPLTPARPVDGWT